MRFCLCVKWTRKNRRKLRFVFSVYLIINIISLALSYCCFLCPTISILLFLSLSLPAPRSVKLSCVSFSITLSSYSFSFSVIPLTLPSSCSLYFFVSFVFFLSFVRARETIDRLFIWFRSIRSFARLRFRSFGCFICSYINVCLG